MLDTTHSNASRSGTANGVALPDSVIAELARLGGVPPHHLPGYCADIRTLFANSTFVGETTTISDVARELADARRDVLRLHRRLAKYRSLASQRGIPSKPRDIATLVSRGFLGNRVGNLMTELASLAEHIRKETEKVTGHPHKRGRRRGARGNPALSDLIFELEFTAMEHCGAGYGLGHASGTGALIRALELLRSYLPEDFIPKAHPISSYQGALDWARDSYAWLNSLEACFDRAIW